MRPGCFQVRRISALTYRDSLQCSRARGSLNLAVSATIDPASAASSSFSARQRSPPSRENASAPDGVCTTRHPLAATTKRRASKDALNNGGNLDDAIEESEPSSKKSKSSSASVLPRLHVSHVRHPHPHPYQLRRPHPCKRESSQRSQPLQLKFFRLN
jgi:hypothetical protein